ncbi:biliverdin-producing heme oxygenase [Devosia chinhatensis]|uniref:biliverdin-producing heme oxygenase n=1 Tax=Devosia chinhatensis TaxID=429727 RepID=UPI0006968C53|nr:biliverdin-producing heme oxygenase [Devosia chinhatensis]
MRVTITQWAPASVTVRMQFLISIVWSDGPLTDGSLRQALRESTQDTHAALDALGDVSTLAHYKRFLLATYQFRHHVEPHVMTVRGWTIAPLVPALHADLIDLEVEPQAADLPKDEVRSHSAQIGTLYVLEGSSLGAKFLFRRAQQIGLTDRFGARHLGQQASGGSRWPKFMQLLDQAIDIDKNAAIAAAQQTFASAYAIYAKAFNDLPQTA